MRKIIDGLVILLVIGLFVGLGSIAFEALKQQANKEKEAREYIGERVVINNDTLVIVNFKLGSIYDEESGFILSNGAIADKNLVLKNLIYEKD